MAKQVNKLLPHAHARVNLEKMRKAIIGFNKYPDIVTAENNQKYIEKCQAYVSSPAFTFGARLIRLLHPQFASFYKDLGEALRLWNSGPGATKKAGESFQAKLPPVIPFVCNGPDYRTVTVFSNLNLSLMNEAGDIDLTDQFFDLLPKIQTTCAYKFYLLLDGLQKDEASGKNPERYKTKSRIWRYLKRHDERATSQVIRNLFADTEKYSNEFVKYVSSAIEDNKKPVEIRYARTPLEFEEMYSNGPHSCMSLPGPVDGWGKYYKEIGMAPVHFYAHCPFAKGAYVAKGKKVLARTILYETAKDVWAYGRGYGEGKDLEKLYGALKKDGYKPLPDRMRDSGFELHKDGVYRPDIEFRVPAFTLNKETVYPITYFDNMRNKYSLSVDEKTNELICRQTDKADGHTIGGASGFIRKSDINGRRCAGCGKPANKHIETLCETYYCSNRCARAWGVVQVTRSDGSLAWMRAENAISLWENKEAYFEHALAAGANGAKPVEIVDGEGIVQEGIVYTTHRPNHEITLPDGAKHLLLAPYGDIIEGKLDIKVKRVRTVIYDEGAPLCEPIKVTPEMYEGLEDNEEVAPGVPSDYAENKIPTRKVRVVTF